MAAPPARRTRRPVVVAAVAAADRSRGPLVRARLVARRRPAARSTRVAVARGPPALTGRPGGATNRAPPPHTSSPRTACAPSPVFPSSSPSARCLARPRRARGAGAQRAAGHRPGRGVDRARSSPRWSRSRSTSPPCSSAPRSWSTPPTTTMVNIGPPVLVDNTVGIAVTGRAPRRRVHGDLPGHLRGRAPDRGPVPVHRGGGDVVRGRDAGADDDGVPVADHLRRGQAVESASPTPSAVRRPRTRRRGSRLRGGASIAGALRRSSRGRWRRRVAAAAAARAGRLDRRASPLGTRPPDVTDGMSARRSERPTLVR